MPESWIAPAFLAAHPVETRPASDFPELPRPKPQTDTPESTRELEEKLRSLGYVE